MKFRIPLPVIVILDVQPLPQSFYVNLMIILAFPKFWRLFSKQIVISNMHSIHIVVPLAKKGNERTRKLTTVISHVVPLEGKEKKQRNKSCVRMILFYI